MIEYKYQGFDSKTYLLEYALDKADNLWKGECEELELNMVEETLELLVDRFRKFIDAWTRMYEVVNEYK